MDGFEVHVEVYQTQDYSVEQNSPAFDNRRV